MEGRPEDRGVNFRALAELFEYANSSVDVDFTFNVSMLEVYNEAVKDLLVVDSDGLTASLEVRVGKGARAGPWATEKLSD